MKKPEKRHIITESDAKILFDGFNDVFFHKKLSHSVKVRLLPSKKMAGLNKHSEADAAWMPQYNEIWIDKIYARSEALFCILLLHEMAHAVLEGTYIGHPSRNPGHGMIYQAEIFRLIMAGAYDGLL